MPCQFGTKLSHDIQRRHELLPGEIYSMFRAGETINNIQHKMSLPKTTVQPTIKNYLNNGKSQHCNGRPKKPTSRNEQHILHLIRANPKITYKLL